MGTSPLYIKQLLASSVYFVVWYIILIKLFFLRFMIKCDKQGPRCHIWYHGRCVKISARRGKKNRQISVITAKIQCIKKNEGILAPKPLGRGIWRDFYVLFPGDLVGFCFIVKTNPRGCPGGQPPGKPMISALCFGWLGWKIKVKFNIYFMCVLSVA